VPKKSALLAKLKMNQRVPNKNVDLLKKSSLMETELGSSKTDAKHIWCIRKKYIFLLVVKVPEI